MSTEIKESSSIIGDSGKRSRASPASSSDHLMGSYLSKMPRKQLEAVARAAMEASKNGEDAGRAVLDQSRDLFVTRALPIVHQNGWLEPCDLIVLSSTCRAAHEDWCTQDEEVWKTLIEKAYGTAILGQMDMTKLLEQYGPSYRAFFANPLAWLALEVERIRATVPEWMERLHFGVQCAICGYHGDDIIPEIPIKSEVRYERMTPITSNGYPVTAGTLGSQFCSPCFEQLVTEGELNRKEFRPISKATFMEACMNEIIHGSGRRIFYTNSNWRKIYKVKPDDVATVISHALVQPNCTCENLGLEPVVQNDHPKFGPKSFKAFAFALGYNTSLKFFQICDKDNDYYFYDDDSEFEEDSNGEYISKPSHDVSNGLLARAVLLNKNSALKELTVSDHDLGRRAKIKLTKIKTDLVCPYTEW